MVSVRRSGIIVVILAAVIAGCQSSSGIITSLDDLSAHVERKGRFTFKQQRLLSLAGLTPTAHPGSLYRYQNARSPFTSIGISTVAAPCDAPCRDTCLTDCDATCNDACSKGMCEASCEGKSERTLSYVERRTIHAEKDTDLTKIRDALVDLRLKASALIRVRLESLPARREASLQGDSPADEPTTDADAGDGSTKETTTDAGDGDGSAKEPDAEQDSSPGADGQADPLTKAQADFDAALAASIKAISQPGVMVLRADTAESRSLSARIGTALGLSDDSESQRNGWVVLAGLRTSFLYVGSDVTGIFDHVSHDWSLIGRKFPYILGASWVSVGGMPIPIMYPGQVGREDFYLVTARLEADRVMYAQDVLTERKIKANLDATLEQIQNDLLAETEKLQVEAILASVESLGNYGILGDVEREFVPLSSFLLEAREPADASEVAVSIQEQGAPAGGAVDSVSTKDGLQEYWHTVYVVMSEIDELSVLAARHPRLHFTSIF